MKRWDRSIRGGGRTTTTRAPTQSSGTTVPTVTERTGTFRTVASWPCTVATWPGTIASWPGTVARGPCTLPFSATDKGLIPQLTEHWIWEVPCNYVSICACIM